ncbi:putative manganese-transporting ATPase PDR2, partial [Sesamum alatum]
TAGEAATTVGVAFARVQRNTRGRSSDGGGYTSKPKNENPRSLLAGSSTSLGTEEIYFDFRKQRFIYSQEKNTFCKLPYPSKETIGYYLKSTGYGTEAKIVAATEKWGRNVFECPQPTFQRLMKEQIMEPFLVFQVCCNSNFHFISTR